MYDSISVFNTCTDINECSTDTHGCQNGATCLNTDGSYTCTCVMGWTGDMCDTGVLALSTLKLCYIVFIVAFVICLCFSLQLIIWISLFFNFIWRNASTVYSLYSPYILLKQFG